MVKWGFQLIEFTVLKKVYIYTYKVIDKYFKQYELMNWYLKLHGLKFGFIDAITKS